MGDDQLKDQAVYEQAWADRYLWERARATGLSRRQLLKLLATGAGVAALGATSGTARRARAQAPPPPIVKPTPEDQFFRFPTNAEMRWEVMADEGYTVPNANFFVRNHTFTPLVDRHTWRLRIEGSGVRRPLELTYDNILDMGSESKTRFIECAGNGRSFFGNAAGAGGVRHPVEARRGRRRRVDRRAAVGGPGPGPGQAHGGGRDAGGGGRRGPRQRGVAGARAAAGADREGAG